MAISNYTVLYDFLEVNGGAESVFLSLLNNNEESNGIVAYVNSDAFSLSASTRSRLTEISSSTSVLGLKSLLGMFAFYRISPKLLFNDLVIYSGSNALLAIRKSTAQKNLYYCHTPPRYAYDLHDYWLGQLSFWQRPLLKILTYLTRYFYRKAIREMDVVVANSENVRNRLKQYLDVDSVVIHPPCNVEENQWIESGDYYLSTARLEAYKRVDKIIEAFKAMPSKKLVITSGGSQYETLKALAAGYENISFTNWVDESELVELMGRAIATIYIPIDEDFGISPVDSMAAGKPVIGVSQGGMLETIADEQTGLLLSVDCSVDELIAAVDRLDVNKAGSMRKACEQRAQKFSEESFYKQLEALLALSS